MKMKTKKSSLKKAIIWILLLLVIAGVCGIFALTRGFRQEPQTMYLQQGEQRILFSETGYKMPAEPEVRFDVKYLAGNTESEVAVQIYSALSIEESFDFKVNGQTLGFFSDRDLSAGFDVKVYDGYFTLRCDRGMREILAAVYGGEVEYIGDVKIDPDKDYFRLEVKSGKNVITIDFKIPVIRVESVTLNITEIILCENK